MATSIFNQTNNLYENPNRNTFDLSFQNNLTFNLGQLIPCMVKEVLPGDTVSLDTTIGLKCLPFIFPVQTRMRAHIHHFYVRNRTLWKDWQDFITMSKDNLVPPYIEVDKSKYFYETGSLSDYLGIPSTYYGPKIITSYQKVITAKRQNLRVVGNIVSYNIGDDADTAVPTILFDDRITYACTNTEHCDFNSLLSDIRASYNNKQDTYEFLPNAFSAKSKLPVVNDTLVPNDKELVSVLSNEFQYTLKSDQFAEEKIYCAVYSDGLLFDGTPTSRVYFLQSDQRLEPIYNTNYLIVVRFKDGYIYKQTYQQDYIDGNVLQEQIDNHGEVVDAMFFFKTEIGNLLLSSVLPYYHSNDSIVTYGFPVFNNINIAYASSLVDKPLDATDNILLPYGSDLQINALPYRAYEMIYNSFYRDSRNNPRIVDGQPEYNKFLPTDEGGADYTPYQIYNRNWEQDFLTTAVHSPQQGVAPLVGVTSLGEFQFKDEEGKIYTAQAEYASDGDTITSFKINSPDMPVGNLRQLVDSVSYGISISDFRNVNALQRWLEINMRRGIRYQDQIKSHYGVDVKYKDYAYPEFLGGHSEEIYINQINQSTPTDGSPLGSFAGQGGTFGSSPHRIEKYCDEHGYIISIVSVTPVANYSQLLPKHFLKNKPLDYFFPEFGHLSMQGITYKEVCPIQAYNSNGAVDLNDTFGYQRAWYEYLASTDEVHGLFRTSLKNFVVHRVFGNVPTLSNDFLTINHKDIDDVFAVSSDESSHKLMGQIYFDLKMKRPIPQYGIPKLEV